MLVAVVRVPRTKERSTLAFNIDTMQAYVIGAGPTGLSASLALRKFAPKRFKRVKLVDLSFKMNHEENVGVGIWKNAFAALLNIINCPEELQKKGRWSRPAAYRRYTDGKWTFKLKLNIIV